MCTIYVYNYAVSYNVCPVTISMAQVSVYISSCILSGFQVFISCGLLQSGPVWATRANVAGSLHSQCANTVEKH